MALVVSPAQMQKSDVAEPHLQEDAIVATELKHLSGDAVPMAHERYAMPVASVCFLIASLIFEVNLDLRLCEADKEDGVEFKSASRPFQFATERINLFFAVETLTAVQYLVACFVQSTSPNRAASFSYYFSSPC